MAIIVRFDKDAARVYRRREESKGEGMYEKLDTRIGTLPLTTTELPAHFPEGHPPLSEPELAALEKKFFKPAKLILERQRFEEQEKLMDPMRRMAEALPLLKEIADLSHERAVEHEALKELLHAVLSVRSTNLLYLLDTVCESAKAAAAAADAGVFGTRPDDVPMKDTLTAGAWNRLNASVRGSQASSLMRALQRARFVKGGDN